MSSESPPTKDEKKEEIVPPAASPRKSTFLGLGIDLNEPLWAGIGLVTMVGLGIAGSHLYRNFMERQQQQQQPPQQELPQHATVEDLRALYQPPPSHPPTEEELYIQSLNTQRQEQRQNNNYYEQYYEAGRQHPDNDVAFVDNNDFQLPPQPSYQPPQRVIQNDVQKMVVRGPIQDSLDMSATQIDNIDVREIPPEFYNVGNVPKAFETIQPREEDPYDISNMEIDENTFKAMEAKAIMQSNKNE